MAEAVIALTRACRSIGVPEYLLSSAGANEDPYDLPPDEVTGLLAELSELYLGWAQ